MRFLVIREWSTMAYGLTSEWPGHDDTSITRGNNIRQRRLTASADGPRRTIVKRSRRRVRGDIGAPPPTQGFPTFGKVGQARMAPPA